MSKSSTASAPKNPTPLPAKSAWARGPPQSSSTAPSTRSQSPAPSTPVLSSHFRRPSTLSLGVPIKDGVSIPRNNVGAVKQGSAVTFGSIGDVSAPVSSSPTAIPLTKSEGVKTFGSVLVAAATGHVNGKPSISLRASTVPPTASTSTAASSVLSAATSPVKPKIDIKKMFQSPSSAPSSNHPSDTLSPSMQNADLPTQQQQQPHQGQFSHTPPNPSQFAHSFTPFVPSNTMRPPESNGPNGGPPRSPQYPPWPSHLASHLHYPQTSTIPPPPQMQPQMQPWYYKYPSLDPKSIRMETEDYLKSWLARPEKNDRLMEETADKEMKEEDEAEAERQAKVSKEIRDLAARLEKARKELLRKKEEERVRKEAEALELQCLKEEEEDRKLKLKQEEKRILKAKQKEKALRLVQERVKEGKERKEKEEREEQERFTKLAEETRLRLEEEAAAKANVDDISTSEPSHSPCEAQARLYLLVKQDGQLEDGRDEDTETSKSMEDGRGKPKDDLRIVEKSMTIHCDEDNTTTSQDSAISLLQEQEDGLTSVQKIAMIFCFMEDVVAAKTYILLTDPEVRHGWILKMLKKCPM